MQRAPADFPRLLFVNDFPPDSPVLADLTRQLLLGYPSDRIAWWYCRETERRDPPDLRAGSLHRFPLPARLAPNRKLTALKCLVLERLWVPRAARHLRRTVAAVQPDLIWVLLFGWPILVARRAALPPGPRLHTSLWDFPDMVASKKILGDARSQRFVEAIFQLVRQANSFDGISPGMLEEITHVTGRTGGLLVHSGFEPQHVNALAELAATSKDNTIRLAYAGTIIYEKAFIEMVAALEKIRATLPRPMVLEFYGGRNYRSRSWFNPQWMHEHGMFTDQGLVESLRRCDWGIVAFDPGAEDPRGSRFSFPNKIGSYLSAGVPVLGISHLHSSLARVMQDHRIGKFTGADQRAALEIFLADCLRLDDPRAIFRDDILRCARTEFNAEEMRNRLWKTWGVQ